MSGKKKILFISSWYPNRTYPTHGIFNQRHAVAVSKFNPVAALHACPDKNVTGTNYEILTFTNEGVFTVLVYYKKIRSSIPLVSEILKFTRQTKAYFKGYNIILKSFGKPDLIHLNIIYPAGIFTLILNFLYKIPFVISEHWSGYLPEVGNYKGFFMKAVTRLAIKKAKTIFVIAEKTKTAMLSYGLKNKFILLPNAVDTNLYHPAQEKKSLNKPVKIIHISTLTDKEKNITGILNAVSKLKNLRQDFTLDLIGHSPECESFKSMAKELDILNKFVFFKGFIPNVQIPDVMRDADFFLLFSNYEGLPCVIVEALACGLPVVSTAVGGIPEVITHEFGITVPAKNEEALVTALNKMIDDHINYDTKKLADFAVINFGYEAIGKKISATYTEALIK